MKLLLTSAPDAAKNGVIWKFCVRSNCAAMVETARLLGVSAGEPLLSVERIAYTYNDVPMELRRGLYRTDTHHYRNQLS